VAIEDSVMVGFGGAVPGQVWAIYVLPSHVKSGIGSMLLSHAMEIALIDNGKVIVKSTLNAVGFYAKKGFVEVEKTIYGPGTIDLPCILMEYNPSYFQP
jgi:GNAT superfamily N-acetyltransferase